MIPLWQSQSGLQYIASLTPAAWYRYGVGITSAGGFVSAWADQSGNARNLAQATGTNQPALDSDNSILFDGVDNFMSASFTLNQPLTVYALVKQVAWAANARIIGGSAALCAIAQDGASVSPDICLIAPNSVARNTNLAVGAFGVVAAVFNGASSSLVVNNTTATTGDVGANNPGGLMLAARADGAANYCNAAFKEVIAFASAHDAATRARVISYLQQVGAL